MKTRYFLQIDEAGELLAVKYTSVDNSSYSDLYQLEDSKFGYVLSKIWTSISLTPVEVNGILHINQLTPHGFSFLITMYV